MVISTYQVNNVLRVYHDQLRNSRASSKAVKNQTQSPDRVTISSNAKQKAVSEKIASSIANKINGYGTKDEIGNAPLKKYEADSEIQSNVSQNISEDLLFKMIDEEGETIKMLNVNDINYFGNSGI
ncbi:MAG: DVU0524 family FlgM-associated protein [Pseudomonadota bacterium]